MKPRNVVLAGALVAVAALACISIRQHLRLAQATEDPFALQGYDTRADLASRGADEMTWAVTGAGVDNCYALFVGEFRNYAGTVRQERPHVVAVKLPTGWDRAGGLRDAFKASAIRLEHRHKWVDGADRGVEYWLNGHLAIRFDRAITSGGGMSIYPPRTMKVIDADARGEGTYGDLSSGAVFNQEEDFGCQWQLFVCNAQFLKRHVDAGDLQYICNGSYDSLFEAASLFRDGDGRKGGAVRAREGSSKQEPAQTGKAP